MSDRQSTRPILPDVIEDIGLEMATTLLGVGNDLRSGAIPDRLYDQGTWATSWPACGTAHCIGGWLAVRMGVEPNPHRIHDWIGRLFIACRHKHVSDGLKMLFSGVATSLSPTAKEAAAAIDNFLFVGGDPWAGTKFHSMWTAHGPYRCASR